MSYKRTFDINLFAEPGDAGDYRVELRRVAEELAELSGYMAKSRGDYTSPADALADIAAELVENAYRATALKMGDDDPIIDIYSESTADGARVVAAGDDVFFLEFGIGDDVSAEGGTYAAESGVPVSPGSWSALHEGPYSKFGYWHYSKTVKNRVGNKKRRSQLYTGVPGSHGMFRAQEHLEKIALKEMEKALRQL